MAALCIAACCCASGQWLHEPIPDAPRTPDGKVDMKGPVKRLNGHPDLSGIWQVEGQPRGPGLFGLGESTNSRYFINILADYKAGEEPLTPAGQEILQRHSQATGSYPGQNCLPDGVPHADLLPEPFKIIETPREILILYEVETTFRQIFTDGRKQLVDPQPAWMGYSTGKWDGDTLVVDTIGFNDLSWLDARGHGHSEDMKVEERFHRRDFGHLDVGVTITDPRTFTKPIAIGFTEDLLPDTDLIEHYCSEDEKDSAHHAGPAAK